MFRDLRADEIECRVQQVTFNGYGLLLYKNARVDMNILDETVGPLLWKREHTRDNANCIVSIYNQELGQWISKEDTGAESYSDAEKGLASDSFKRACTNWGIGRELYTSPRIWITDKDLIVEKNGKYHIKSGTTFEVYHIKVENGEITELGIRALSYGNPVKNIFKWKKL